MYKKILFSIIILGIGFWSVKGARANQIFFDADSGRVVLGGAVEVPALGFGSGVFSGSGKSYVFSPGYETFGIGTASPAINLSSSNPAADYQLTVNGSMRMGPLGSGANGLIIRSRYDAYTAGITWANPNPTFSMGVHNLIFYIGKNMIGNGGSTIGMKIQESGSITFSEKFAFNPSKDVFSNPGGYTWNNPSGNANKFVDLTETNEKQISYCALSTIAHDGSSFGGCRIWFDESDSKWKMYYEKTGDGGIGCSAVCF